ncbi:MAG: metal-dependent exonucleaseMrfB [Anaerolineae bacterium]
MRLDRDRLDRLLRPYQRRRERALQIRPQAPQPHTSPGFVALEAIAGAREHVTPAGTCLLVERRYPLDTERGGVSLGELATLPADVAEWLDQEPVHLAGALFIDAETTGLAGGTGTLAFMVGVGELEGEAFVVRQYFLRSPEEEPALLHALSERWRDRSGVVTFNGRAFDLPLLETRFRLNGARVALDQPHFDVLNSARRLWRRRLPSCALTALERDVLGYQRDAADVPGWLIPTLYQQYLQVRDLHAVAGIFYHNREDILSMAALSVLLGRACLGLDGLHPADAVSLAIARAGAGDVERAETLLRWALERRLAPPIRRLAYSHLGHLLKRQERWDDAVAVWARWADDGPTADVEPYEELAKYYEWHAKDLDQALRWTDRACHLAETWNDPLARRRALADLKHRLERLQRKIARQAADQDIAPSTEDEH